MYNKEMLIGIFLAKGNFVSVVSRNDSTKIGYKVLLFIYLRGNLDFLKAVKRSLHTVGIESKLEKNRLKISSDRIYKILDMIPEYTIANKNTLDEFRQIADLIKNKKHLTLKGLEIIMKMKGAIE